MTGAGPQPPRLPLNRKERYYTGTVLPMVVASDGFAHLHRLLTLCGLPGVDVHADTDGFQFFTEYSFAESIHTPADRAAWPGAVAADTPDVVLAGPDWLLAVEAKMFHNPNASALEAQMSRQAGVIDVWRGGLGLAGHRVRHVLLLPHRLAERVGPLRYPVVTWESVLDAYDVVGPPYWVGVLRTALHRHEELEATRDVVIGANAEQFLTGAEIVEQYADGVLTVDQVGRLGGLAGARFRQDVASGRWRTTTYEGRTGAAPNRNWFSVADFLAAVTPKDRLS